jgi:hypothetical protein
VQDSNYSPLGQGASSDVGNVYSVLSRDNGRAESRGENYSKLGQRVRLTRSGNSLPLQLLDFLLNA